MPCTAWDTAVNVTAIFLALIVPGEYRHYANCYTYFEKAITEYFGPT